MEDIVKLPSTMKMRMVLEYSIHKNKLQIDLKICKDGYYEILEKNINRTQFDMNAASSLWIYLLEKWKINHKSENGTKLTLKAFTYQKETLKERQGQPSE